MFLNMKCRRLLMPWWVIKPGATITRNYEKQNLEMEPRGSAYKGSELSETFESQTIAKKLLVSLVDFIAG